MGFYCLRGSSGAFVCALHGTCQHPVIDPYHVTSQLLSYPLRIDLFFVVSSASPLIPPPSYICEAPVYSLTSPDSPSSSSPYITSSNSLFRSLSFTPWALQQGAQRLLEAFERYGHHEADTDPLGLTSIQYVEREERGREEGREVVISSVKDI